MKTTLDIADLLFNDAKKTAQHHGISMRALMERGLQLAIAERERRPTYELPDRSVAGQGLQPDAGKLSWDELRDLSYAEQAR